MFKESHELKPEDLGFQRISPDKKTAQQGFRPYHNTYIPRTAIPFEQKDKEVSSVNPSLVYSEEQLIQFLEDSSGLLLIGGPTEGKTRTLYEIIRQLPQFIVIKIRQGKEPDENALNLLKNRNVLWLVDDLHILAEAGSTPSGARLALTELLIKINKVATHCALAGTSRNAGELDKFDLTTSPVREFYSLFKCKLVLTRPGEEDFKKLQTVVGNAKVRRFPTIGSVVMQEHFEEMHKRFRLMKQLEQHCVLALILLNEAYIYQMTQRRIGIVLREVFEHGNAVNTPALLAILDRLKEDGFITAMTSTDAVIAEAAYITGEEADYYYSTGTRPLNRKPEDDLDKLAQSLLKNRDAEGMDQLALSRYYANQHENAIHCWGKIDIQFKGSSDLAVREQVAKALINRGTTLSERGQFEEEIECYKLVEERYANATEPALRERVAKALFNKGTALSERGQFEAAIECYKLVEERYANATEPALREQVARALVDRGWQLGQRGKYEAAARCYELVEERYGDATELALRVQVARALVSKGWHWVRGMLSGVSDSTR